LNGNDAEGQFPPTWTWPKCEVGDSNPATGEAQTVLYQQLSGMLLNELQKQQRQVQELTERLSRLEQVLTAQQSFAALAK